jgi:hypothetical protein
MPFHLAQVTIAQLRHSLDHPAAAGLASRIAVLNLLAERSPGFVWRLKDVRASDLELFSDLFDPFDPARLFYTLSVWTDVDSLRRYVYQSAHAEMLSAAARHAWMVESSVPNLALWWLPVGIEPTVADSASRWRSLRDLGPTDTAFNFRTKFAAASNATGTT